MLKADANAGDRPLASAAQTFGPEGGRRMFFVHGLAASRLSFAKLVPHWRAPTRSFFLDTPWSAPLDGPPLTAAWPLRSDNAALLAAAIANAGGAPDVLLAHSFGALVTLEALSRELIEKPQLVVLVAPFYRASVDTFDWRTLDYYVNDFHLVLAEGLAAANPRLLNSTHLSEMAYKVREHIGPLGWMHFFRAYLSTPTLDLRPIDMPVAIIAGARDISAFPEDALALAAKLPRAECAVFEDSGHFLFLEDPARFAAFVESKCERQLHFSEPGGRFS